MLNHFYSLLGYVEKPLCEAGDLLCQITEGASTLKDYLPDMIEPAVFSALDFVDQNRMLSLVTTSVMALGSAALWRYHSMRNQYLARSSGYRNNCGLNSIIHTFLGLPENKMKSLIEQHPIFTEIIRAFADYYQLGACSVDDFVRLCSLYNHPWDREILLGQIFREVLITYVDENEYGEVIDDQPIPDDLLSVLTEQMGASLTIHNTREFQSIQKAVTYPPHDAPSWHIEIHHVGGHYDFKYANYHESVRHNKERQNHDNSLLFQAIKGRKVNDHKALVTEQVQLAHLQLTYGTQQSGYHRKKGY